MSIHMAGALSLNSLNGPLSGNFSLLYLLWTGVHLHEMILVSFLHIIVFLVVDEIHYWVLVAGEFSF